MLRTLFLNRGFVFYLALCGLYGLYLVLGAGMFTWIEGGSVEEQKIARFSEVREKFKSEHGIDDQTLDVFLEQVLETNAKGLGVLTGKLNESNWVFSKSFMFVTTLITTVGYGSVSPSSDSGKICCILYAAIGIPMTIMLFAATIERLFYLCYRSIKQFVGIRYGINEQNVRLLLFIAVLAFILVFVFLIPSLVFYGIERPKWSYLDSIYFCFISVSTIGLGDYVPGDNISSGSGATAYKLASSAYIVIGALFMLFLVTATSIVPYFKLGKCYHLRYENEPEDLSSLINHQVGSVPNYIRQIDSNTAATSTRNDHSPHE